MNMIGIIPARYASSRFPGKPLSVIKGKPMIQWVYELACKTQSLKRVVVATDDDRISGCVKGFGGDVVMTSSAHLSGTDRCAEAAELLKSQGVDFQAVINIQGDEPFLDPGIIDKLAAEFADQTVEIATIAGFFDNDKDVLDPNKVKVVTDIDHNALYFSRSPIPFLRSVGGEKPKYLRHAGIYGYRADVLQKITRLMPGKLELAESLEQLRWLENGYRIRVIVADYQTVAIDTPDDLTQI
ncbi:MAG: 3-deoxy-manno-octulosonate cytidylyltransferase [Bacteroidetes bacterium]|nr:3-deoxy-manno-octulosonate cytidylyltransferase [Bacteroidota bacterium]MBU1720226.1 3-deoxy-manno-octulosonate cytidylyltransferase [Bacteroidota bacterium]